MSSLFFSKAPRVPAVAVFFLLLIVYSVSMPSQITLEDAGLFQMICHQGGIGHPPGYPLFVLGCQGFVNLPFFSDTVFAGNFLSAIYAALTCSILVLVGFEMTGRQDFGLLLAVFYGLSATFWSQAIIIEVYSLQALLYVVLLYLVLVYRREGDRRLLFALAFVSGLSLSNHWPLQLLAAPSLLAVLWPRIPDALTTLGNLRYLVLAILLFLSGLLPYVSLLQESPDFAVYGPVNSLVGFIDHITRAAYTDQSAVAGMEDLVRFQAWLAVETLFQFSFMLAPLLLVGLYLSFRELPLSLAVGFLLLYLSATTFLLLLTGFEFNNLRLAIFKPYPVIGYLGPAVWVTLGVTWLGRLLPMPSAFMRWVVPAGLILAVLVGNGPMNYRRDDNFAARYAEEVLKRVHEDSVLFVEGDNGVGLFGYLHHVEGQRQDLELKSWNNLVFRDSIASPFSTDEVQDVARRTFIKEEKKPVYATVSHNYPAQHEGLVFRLGVEPGFSCDEELHEYIESLVALEHSGTVRDGHVKELLFGILLDVTRQHMGLILAGGGNREEFLINSLLQETYPGKLGSLETMVKFEQNSKGKAFLSGLAESAIAQQPENMSRQVRGVLEEFRGRIALMEPRDLATARTHLEASLEIYPTSENTALCVLGDVLRLQEDYESLQELKRGYPAGCLE